MKQVDLTRSIMLLHNQGRTADDISRILLMDIEEVQIILEKHDAPISLQPA